MGEHKHSATCPICSGALTDLTEAALVDKVQRHVKDAHDKDLTTEQARMLFNDRAEE
jgi:hypothetical protein